MIRLDNDPADLPVGPHDGQDAVIEDHVRHLSLARPFSRCQNRAPSAMSPSDRSIPNASRKYWRAASTRASASSLVGVFAARSATTAPIDRPCSVASRASRSRTALSTLIVVTVMPTSLAQGIPSVYRIAAA